MSVQINQYLMFGVKLPFEKSEFSYEKYEPYLDSPFEGIRHHNGLCVVDDGMNGKYMFIGRVLAKSLDGNHIEGPFDCTTELSITNKDMLSALIRTQFGIEKPEIKLWFFTHYR